MNIFVGNLAQQISDEELEKQFKEFGEIRSIKIIRDMFTQESKGFGFVEMKDKSAGEKAIKELNAKDIGGKKIVVNEARPKSDSRRSFGNRSGNNFNKNKGGGKRW